MKRVKLFIIVICILAMLVPMNSSMAWLVHTSGNDSTTMTKGNIAVEAYSLSGHVFPNQLVVKNNGNTKCWIRVIVDINWVNETTDNWWNGSQWVSGRLIYGESPRDSAGTYPNGMPWTADYTMTDWTADKHWLKGAEKGVFYYVRPLNPNEQTPQVVNLFQVHRKTLSDTIQQDKSLTFNLTVDVSVDAIQYEEPSRFSGTPAVVTEWGVTLNSDKNQITKAPVKDYSPSVYS
ncbi:MAG: hypothetical protein IKU10_05285 [Clostridia bacterium]|nr:hypothetical protein [Clostridia bacterium]